MSPVREPLRLAGFKTPDKILGRMPASLLLAYSGGADSSLLLFLLDAWCKENGVALYAAHVNHSIRGGEALRDRDFCVQSAKDLGIKCFVLDADVPGLARERKKGLEETAREVRYGFFREIMEKYGIDALATAHNADDNLETLIFRMTRGSGARGLCGIPEKRELGVGMTAVRPILSLSKKEILDICRQNGIKYVCDSTNADDAYSRNRIRLNVIPELEMINPSVRTSAARLSALLSDDCDFIEGEASEYAKTEDRFKLGRLKTLHPALLRRVLAKMIADATDAMPEFIHLEALSRLISEGKPHSSISLPGDTEAVIDFDRLVIRKKHVKSRQPAAAHLCGEMPLSEGENRFAYFILTLTFTPNTHKNQTANGNIYKLFTQVSVSSDKIVGKLFCRPRCAGDRIKSGGMSKDVRKLFSEAKIPLDLREHYPIVCDGEGILWIPGIALRDGAAVGESSALIITCGYVGDEITDIL